MLLSGCSAYQAVRSQDDGGHQPDGSYVLTAEERAQDCRALRGWIRGYADSIQKLALERAKRRTRERTPVFSRLTRSGGGRGTGAASQTICNQYAIIIAMNRELEERRCEAVDISAILAEGESKRSAPEAGADGPVEAWGVDKGPTRSEYREAMGLDRCRAEAQ